MSWETKGF
jgi:hypothetical protein